MDIQTKTAAIGLVMCAAIIGVILLGGCAGGSSSGNYHNTFRPATGQPGSVN